MSLQDRRGLPKPEEVRRMNGMGILFPTTVKPPRNSGPRGPQAQSVIDARKAKAAKNKAGLIERVTNRIRLKGTATIADVVEVTGSTYFATQKTIKWMREAGIIEYVPGCYGAGKQSIFRLPEVQPEPTTKEE